MVIDTDRVGVLVLRVWTEGPVACLRARIIETGDLARGDETSHVSTSVDDLVCFIRAWLDAFISEGPEARRRG